MSEFSTACFAFRITYIDYHIYSTSILNQYIPDFKQYIINFFAFLQEIGLQKIKENYLLHMDSDRFLVMGRMKGVMTGYEISGLNKKREKQYNIKLTELDNMDTVNMINENYELSFSSIKSNSFSGIPITIV